MDMSGYKISNENGFRYIFATIDKFSERPWCIPLKNKYGPTKTDEVSNTLTISKTSPIKIESDRGKQTYTSVFQNFMNFKNIYNIKIY